MHHWAGSGGAEADLESQDVRWDGRDAGAPGQASRGTALARWPWLRRDVWRPGSRTDADADTGQRVPRTTGLEQRAYSILGSSARTAHSVESGGGSASPSCGALWAARRRQRQLAARGSGAVRRLGAAVSAVAMAAGDACMHTLAHTVVRGGIQGRASGQWCARLEPARGQWRRNCIPHLASSAVCSRVGWALGAALIARWCKCAM